MKSAKLNPRENYKLTKPRNPRKLIPAKINPYKVDGNKKEQNCVDAAKKLTLTNKIPTR